jgi:hypothetical protein
MWTHALPIPLMGQLLRCLGFAALVLVWATVLGSPPVHAQTFNSGSTGADGALNLTTPGTVIFNPDTFTPPLDPEGDNIYHFTTINIAAGVTVRLLATHVNGPVFWLASGAVQIDGTLDLNGGVGHNPPATPAARLPSVPGAGGYPGGIGASPNGPAQPGSGPLGGVIGPGNSSGGGGGNPSNSFLVPLLGGSGGGGTQTGVGGGGGGGGALDRQFTVDCHHGNDAGYWWHRWGYLCRGCSGFLCQWWRGSRGLAPFRQPSYQWNGYTACDRW